jgi:hypothetical protein
MKEWDDEESVFECWECHGSGYVEFEEVVGGRYSGSGDPWQGYETRNEECLTCAGEGEVAFGDLGIGDDPWKLKLAH